MLTLKPKPPNRLRLAQAGQGVPAGPDSALANEQSRMIALQLKNTEVQTKLMTQRLQDLENENTMIRDQLIQKRSPQRGDGGRESALSPGRRGNYVSKDKFENSIADVMRATERQNRAMAHDLEAATQQTVTKRELDETVRSQQEQIDELKTLLKRRSHHRNSVSREELLQRQHRNSVVKKRGGSVPHISDYESGNSEAEYDALTANLDRLDQLKRQLSTPRSRAPSTTKQRLLAAAKGMSAGVDGVVDGAGNSSNPPARVTQSYDF